MKRIIIRSSIYQLWNYVSTRVNSFYSNYGYTHSSIGIFKSPYTSNFPSVWEYVKRSFIQGEWFSLPHCVIESYLKTSICIYFDYFVFFSFYLFFWISSFDNTQISLILFHWQLFYFWFYHSFGWPGANV